MTSPQDTGIGLRHKQSHGVKLLQRAVALRDEAKRNYSRTFESHNAADRIVDYILRCESVVEAARRVPPTFVCNKCGYVGGCNLHRSCKYFAVEVHPTTLESALKSLDELGGITQTTGNP